ncbi:HAD-IIB family hydrolase [Deinococcus roseus]|uniref:Hydrolase n=1 Tax=Deinococcus roseus TaxID=392414 RepID=A0ABQ2DD23_9DEIO|nr:HAD family hydrolase [Deinococcus roseus]GGJ53855.1 hydrolase [Deinococcus roseus]
MSTHLLAFDFDGTLFDEHQQQVPEEIFPLIQQAHDAGIKIVLITGRWELPPEFLKRLPHHARATSNGGQVRIQDEIHVQHLISQQDVQRIVELTHLEAELYAFSTTHFFTRAPEGARSKRWSRYLPVKPFQEVFGADVMKLNVDHTSVPDLKTAVAEHLPHLTLTGGQEPYLHFLTITPTAANKAEALKYIASTLGVGLSNTTVFGDSDNDIEMLRLAGHAVQVGHMPYLQEVSDEQLDHPRDVARWLQNFLKNIHSGVQV